MARYHINKNGVPAVCHAQPGKCPLGGENQHFKSIEDAQAAADKMGINNFATQKTKYTFHPTSDSDRAAILSLNPKFQKIPINYISSGNALWEAGVLSNSEHLVWVRKGADENTALNKAGFSTTKGGGPFNTPYKVDKELWNPDTQHFAHTSAQVAEIMSDQAKNSPLNSEEGHGLIVNSLSRKVNPISATTLKSAYFTKVGSQKFGPNLQHHLPGYTEIHESVEKSKKDNRALFNRTKYLEKHLPKLEGSNFDSYDRAKLKEISLNNKVIVTKKSRAGYAPVYTLHTENGKIEIKDATPKSTTDDYLLDQMPEQTWKCTEYDKEGKAKGFDYLATNKALNTKVNNLLGE
jgi:hypothetical protein